MNRKTVAMIVASSLAVIGIAIGAAAIGFQAARRLPAKNNTPIISPSDTVATSAVASPTPTIPPPILSKISETKISGGNQWLFAINDGQPRLAVSTETGGKILMGRLDPNQPDAAVNWQTVANSADTDGVNIADHWHIFAHDAHWIAFSVSTADHSYLLKLDKNFKRLSLTPIAKNDKVATSEITALGITLPKDNLMAEDAKPVVTNDMFLIDEPAGVAVAHMIPGVGLRIYRFDTAGMIMETKIVGGGDYVANNGSSAVRTAHGYDILGAENLNVVAQGAVKLVKTNRDWQPLSATKLLDEDKTNSSMATSVELPNDYRIVTLRQVSGTNARGQLPPPPKPGQPLANDGGAIVRYIFAPDGKQTSRETIADGSDGNRPHTSLIGDKLVTTWDTTGKLYLRVDSIK